jgi:hypothetical protein
MPHLHLPAAHSDADLALAADVAAWLGSDELYVTWSYAEGAGAVPEVEAFVRDERPVHPFAAVVVALMQGIVTLWQTVSRGPSPRPAPRREAPARPERATGEPAA